MIKHNGHITKNQPYVKRVYKLPNKLVVSMLLLQMCRESCKMDKMLYHLNQNDFELSNSWHVNGIFVVWFAVAVSRHFSWETQLR